MPTRSHTLDRARTARVVHHLADHSFTGHVKVETVREEDEVLTVVRRADPSVEWTDHVHAWVKDTLRGIPGVAAIRTAGTQSVTVVWVAPLEGRS